ncbi:MAG: pantetheine-phosphate adenylyltransferase [Eubacteriales bacterium]
MEKICIYPGSFDPITNGHMDIIDRSSKIFDKIIVAVLMNASKTPMFSVEERMDLIRKSTEHLPNVEVDSFKGLLVHYLEEKNVNIVIRGLRAVSDFEHEFSMAALNAHMYPKIETILMMTRTENSFLSSSFIKDIARNKGDIKDFVPSQIVSDITKKIQEERFSGK